VFNVFDRIPRALSPVGQDRAVVPASIATVPADNLDQISLRRDTFR
jgi:hypothetical protein